MKTQTPAQIAADEMARMQPKIAASISDARDMLSAAEEQKNIAEQRTARNEN